MFRMHTEKGHRDGTDRICDPATTLRRTDSLRSICGITRVANLTGLDVVGVPVVSVCRPNSRSIVVAQGKGATLEAAKASGIMEAIEAYHAESLELPLLLGSQQELRSRGHLVEVAGLPRTLLHFKSDTRILWVEAQDIARDRVAVVPHELVHTDYTLPLPAGSGCFLMSSNGLASGNHLLEAISHGICELIERDAVTLDSYRAEQRRIESKVDLSTVADPRCRDVLDRFAAAGIACQVFEVTSDVKVPVFRCEVAELDGGASNFSMPPLRGTGCHPRREIALLRALTEAAQTRVTMISGARDDLSPWWYADKDRVVRARRSFLARQRQPATRAFIAAPHFDARTLESDVNWQIERLAEAGLESVLVVNLTKPGLGLPVCRVIIPHLEPMREAPGYQPGQRAMSVARAA